MAFFLRKAGGILGKTLSSGVKQDISVSSPSIFLAKRCITKISVEGLSAMSDEVSLREAFEKYGKILDVEVIYDRETGFCDGFGFVTFPSFDETSAAIRALDKQELDGSKVRVNYAKERPPSGGGYEGGNYGGGGYGDGGGGGYDDNYNSGGSSYGSGAAGGESQFGSKSYASNNDVGADAGSCRDVAGTHDNHTDGRG